MSHRITVDEAKEYARPFINGAVTNVIDLSGGNVNVVLRVIGEGKSSVIVKQAVPYLKMKGENWPLTPDRARIEVRALEVQRLVCPDLVPSIYSFDAENSVIMMEDLYDYKVLRDALIDQKTLPNVMTDVGRFCAKTLLTTSDIMNGIELRRKKAAEFINAEMCDLLDLSLYVDPYVDAQSDLTRIDPQILSEATQVWQDKNLRGSVEALRFQYRTRSEALLHGDLHLGSIMVTEDETKIIDPEFACYGPIGFDTGMFLGNLALSYLSHFNLKHTNYANWLFNQIATFWHSFSTEIRVLWPSNSPWLDRFLRDVLQDSAGHAGVEMISRILGLAPVVDTSSISDPDIKVKTQIAILKAGKIWIQQSKDIENIDDMLKLLS